MVALGWVGLGNVIIQCRTCVQIVVTKLLSCRDLKPENVVFFEKLGMVKLTDFGFSNKFDPGQRLMTSCGSLAYSAPEILLGKGSSNYIASPLQYSVW